MKNEYMDNLETLLEQRIKNMNVFINEPGLATKEDFGYRDLPVVKIGYIYDDDDFKQFCRVNALLTEYFQCEKKVLAIGKALDLVGKKVLKGSKKPFKCGNHVVTVKALVRHPYRPGWDIAFSFEENDAVVSVDKVREYRG